MIFFTELIVLHSENVISVNDKCNNALDFDQKKVSKHAFCSSFYIVTPMTL